MDWQTVVLIVVSVFAGLGLCGLVVWALVVRSITRSFGRIGR